MNKEFDGFMDKPYEQHKIHMFNFLDIPEDIRNWLRTTFWKYSSFSNDIFLHYVVNGEDLSVLDEEDAWRIGREAADRYFAKFLPEFDWDDEGPAILIKISW